MRQPFFALMVFTALSPVSAWAKDIPVESTIRAATVYSDRATLTRSVKIDIPAGAHNLVFTGLPVSLFADSLRTEGRAKANVTFGALTHKRESHEDYVVPKEKELHAQLVVLQDQNKLSNVEKKALRAGQTFLENIGKQAALRTNEDIAKIELNSGSWSAAADSLSAKMLENMKGLLALDIKIRDTNAKIRRIQNELRGLRTGQKQTYSVTVPFESDNATTLNIDLSYQLPGVSWQPIYDARLDVKSGELELVQYGSVWQRTGEDWTDIELTLSTASAAATLQHFFKKDQFLFLLGLQILRTLCGKRHQRSGQKNQNRHHNRGLICTRHMNNKNHQHKIKRHNRSNHRKAQAFAFPMNGRLPIMVAIYKFRVINFIHNA